MGRILASTVAALLLVCAPAHAQVVVYEVFGAYLDSLREQAAIPGLAAAIVDDTGVVWERAYGKQDIGRGIATRVDTPFNADGLTQVFTASLALRCAEERRLSLDARLSEFPVLTSEPDATLRQLLTHTYGPPDNLSFAYRPERLDPLSRVLRTCTIDSYRESLSNLFKRLAMNDTVPGANILTIVPPAEGVPDPEDVERYAAILQRRATPYVTDFGGGVAQSFYPDATAVLTPGGGVVTTVLDLAKFDLALRQGLIVFPETLAAAWATPSSNGAPLPHGMGWFAQQFNGELVAWQFGMTPGASSSLMLKLPSRGLTLILMANSDGLLRLYSPENGDISLSPFARLFLNLFTQ